MKRKLLLILALLIFIGTESWGQRFAPPGGGGGGVGGEVTVSLSPSSLTMTVGEGAKVQLSCETSGYYKSDFEKAFVGNQQLTERQNTFLHQIFPKILHRGQSWVK